MIDLDPTLHHRLARPVDPAPGRSLTARAAGGLAVTLGGLAIGISSAVIALYGLGAAIVTYRLWPL
ncbi:hypothetical protein BBK14_11105 [Parafrankia soli]|uniref:Uncharacterized protein n=1 Tax=Parafrankia soli TaxID=2599596 RepID=A0A1S1RA71_9ACTN|nr:hypothetical protein [Parafrankia soli]OHV42162.1 hypothetical protein BBK14_11105 [Parafrankia soli]